jgi:Ca2+/Na+ antiporter
VRPDRFSLCVRLWIPRGPSRINRVEGAILLACYVGYTLYLVNTTFLS